MKRRVGQPSEDSFTAFVIDQLRSLGVVEARAMFGGKGLYWKDQIFGLIDEGRVYFRVSDPTVSRYAAQGSNPFEPWPGHVMKGYYEVPAAVRSEEHTSELQSRLHLVCRLLLEKKTVT